LSSQNNNKTTKKTYDHHHEDDEEDQEVEEVSIQKYAGANSNHHDSDPDYKSYYPTEQVVITSM